MKSLEITHKYRKTKKGLVTNLYHKMKSRHEVFFDLQYLHEFSNCLKFDRIFIEWEKSKYNTQLKPSIDRISNKKPYQKDNIHWLTWAENRHKQTMERRSRKGCVAKILNNVIIDVYKSQKQAAIKNNICQSNLSSVLNNKRKYCAGFNWAYVSNSTTVGNIHENTQP